MFWFKWQRREIGKKRNWLTNQRCVHYYTSNMKQPTVTHFPRSAFGIRSIQNNKQCNSLVIEYRTFVELVAISKIIILFRVQCTMRRCVYVSVCFNILVYLTMWTLSMLLFQEKYERINTTCNVWCTMFGAHVPTIPISSNP